MCLPFEHGVLGSSLQRSYLIRATNVLSSVIFLFELSKVGFRITSQNFVSFHLNWKQMKRFYESKLNSSLMKCRINFESTKKNVISCNLTREFQQVIIQKQQYYFRFSSSVAELFLDVMPRRYQGWIYHMTLLECARSPAPQNEVFFQRRTFLGWKTLNFAKIWNKLTKFLRENWKGPRAPCLVNPALGGVSANFGVIRRD